MWRRGTGAAGMASAFKTTMCVTVRASIPCEQPGNFKNRRFCRKLCWLAVFFRKAKWSLSKTSLGTNRIGSSSASAGAVCHGSAFVAAFLSEVSETSAICGSQQQEQLVFQAIEKVCDLCR